MKVFTYSDYIRCIHNLRREDITGLAEEGVQYNLKVNNRKNSNNVKEIVDQVLDFSDMYWFYIIILKLYLISLYLNN